jgi:hypothetical protein
LSVFIKEALRKDFMLPVFIGGHPRSGTTLLGDLIGSHSDCICTPESQFKISIYRRQKVQESDVPDVRKAAALIGKHWRFRIWGVDIDEIPYSGIPSYRDLILGIVKAYANKFSKSHAGMWIDHTPANIQYTDILAELFPAARFIHLVRDGRAVAASIIPLDWGANTIDRAAYSWMECISCGIAAEACLGDERILRVRFEDLIQQPHRTLERICIFLNLQYQPRMTQGGGFRVPGYTAGQHSLLGKEPDAQRAHAWGKKLTSRQIEIFESIAGELLSSLGYPLTFGKSARKMKGMDKMVSCIQELYKGKIVNKFRRRERKKGIETAGRQ